MASSKMKSKNTSNINEYNENKSENFHFDRIYNTKKTYVKLSSNTNQISNVKQLINGLNHNRENITTIHDDYEDRVIELNFFICSFSLPRRILTIKVFYCMKL